MEWFVFQLFPPTIFWQVSIMEEEEDIFAFDSLFYTEPNSREQAKVSLVDQVFQRKLYFCPTHVIYPSTHTLDRLHAKVRISRTNQKIDSSWHHRFWVYSVFLRYSSLQPFSRVWHRSVPRVFDRSFSERGLPSVWLSILSSPHVSKPLQVRYHSNSFRESLEWPADHRVVPLCGWKERSTMSQCDSGVDFALNSNLKNDRPARLERRNASLSGRLFHISELFWVWRIQRSHHHLLCLEAVQTTHRCNTKRIQGMETAGLFLPLLDLRWKNPGSARGVDAVRAS